MTTVLKDARHVARKAHYCGWCGTKILPGDQYRRVAYIDYDVGFTEWKECADCTPLYNVVLEWQGGYWHEGLGPDDFIEWARECSRSDARAAAFLARFR